MTPAAENKPIDFFSENPIEDINVTIDEGDWNSIPASPLKVQYYPASITYRRNLSEYHSRKRDIANQG